MDVHTVRFSFPVVVVLSFKIVKYFIISTRKVYICHSTDASDDTATIAAAASNAAVVVFVIIIVVAITDLSGGSIFIDNYLSQPACKKKFIAESEGRGIRKKRLQNVLRTKNSKKRVMIRYNAQHTHTKEIQEINQMMKNKLNRHNNMRWSNAKD